MKKTVSLILALALCLALAVPAAAEPPQEFYVVPMYTLNGQVAYIWSYDVGAYQAVGWYLFFDAVNAAVDLGVNGKQYDTALLALDFLKKCAPEYEEYLTACKEQLCASWSYDNNCCPIVIRSYRMGQNSIGTPEVTIYFKSLVGKMITRLDFDWVCLDAYGRQTSDYSFRTGAFHGYTVPSYKVYPYADTSCTWTLYGNEETAYIGNLVLTSAAFVDGTSWHA